MGLLFLSKAEGKKASNNKVLDESEQMKSRGIAFLQLFALLLLVFEVLILLILSLLLGFCYFAGDVMYDP